MGDGVWRYDHVEVSDIGVERAVQNALLGYLSGEHHPASTEPPKQVVQGRGVEDAVANFGQESAVPGGDNWFHQIGAFSGQGRADDVTRLGGEVSVVVVDVDQVDVVALADTRDEVGQRLDDLGDAGDLKFGVGMLVAVHHVDDQHGDVSHDPVIPQNGDLVDGRLRRNRSA